MMGEYDIHISSVAFTQAVCNFEAECAYKTSIGSALCFSSNKVESRSPFVEGTKADTNIDLGLNFYSDNVSAATHSRSKGVSSDHLSKIWSIDKEAADMTIDYTTQLQKQYTGDEISR